jgi:hypothetical protein
VDRGNVWRGVMCGEGQCVDMGKVWTWVKCGQG